jgi:hypothetical protein
LASGASGFADLTARKQHIDPWSASSRATHIMTSDRIAGSKCEHAHATCERDARELGGKPHRSLVEKEKSLDEEWKAISTFARRQCLLAVTIPFACPKSGDIMGATEATAPRRGSDA